MIYKYYYYYMIALIVTINTLNISIKVKMLFLINDLFSRYRGEGGRGGGPMSFSL